MREKKKWNPTITHHMKDGTVMTAEEWDEYWKTHTLPLNEDTEPFYRALAAIVKKKMQEDNKKPPVEEAEVQRGQGTV